MPQVVGVPVLPRPVVPALVEPQVVAAADLALLDVVSNRLRLFRFRLNIIVIADIVHILYVLLYFS